MNKRQKPIQSESVNGQKTLCKKDVNRSRMVLQPKRTFWQFYFKMNYTWMTRKWSLTNSWQWLWQPLKPLLSLWQTLSTI